MGLKFIDSSFERKVNQKEMFLNIANFLLEMAVVRLKTALIFIQTFFRLLENKFVWTQSLIILFLQRILLHSNGEVRKTSSIRRCEKRRGPARWRRFRVIPSAQLTLQ